MSEYQYYEFQAIDRRLDDSDREALRALSTRAKITSTSFTNHYEWGDFRGDPDQLMDRYFDLHLYTSNWGTRRLMIRLPSRLVDLAAIDRFVGESDDVTVRKAGSNLIVSIGRDELDIDDASDEEEDDDSHWLATITPLRDDLLGGDLRMFYLMWLADVERGRVAPEAVEPQAGLGPVTLALGTFADFFCIDADLVSVAAERVGVDVAAPASPKAIRGIVAALPDADRIERLARLVEGDAHVGGELRAHVRRQLAGGAGHVPPTLPLRTAGELTALAKAIRDERLRARAVEKAEQERRNREADAKDRRARLDAISRRGDSVWREIEGEIQQRNAGGYGRAINLLSALKTLAAEQGTTEDFASRLDAIRQMHAKKPRFIERLAGL